MTPTKTALFSTYAWFPLLIIAFFITHRHKSYKILAKALLFGWIGSVSMLWVLNLEWEGFASLFFGTVLLGLGFLTFVFPPCRLKENIGS